MAMNARTSDKSVFGENGYWRKIGLISVCAAALLGAGSLYAESGHHGPHGDCMDESVAGEYSRHHEDGHGGHWQHHKREGGGHFDRGGEHLQKMAELLQLTDDQQTAIEDILISARDEGKELHTKNREARAAVKDALRNDAKEKDLRKLARAAADARVDLMLHKRRTQAAVEAQLNEDQKAEMKAWRENMKDRWGERGRGPMEQE